MEDIIHAEYAHAKRVCKDYKIKDSGEYHDFYVQSDTLEICVLKHTNLIGRNFFQLHD